MVRLAIGDESVLMTPREAQRFAFWLARCYCKAGGLHKSKTTGALVLQQEEEASDVAT